MFFAATILHNNWGNALIERVTACTWLVEQVEGNFEYEVAYKDSYLRPTKMKKDNPSQTNKDAGWRTLSVDTRRAAVGGVIAAVVALAGALVVNISSGGEAQTLLEGMLPSIRFLCSAVTTATATILALMLTMLSLSLAREGQFKPSYYDRVRQIAFVDTGTFAAAIILLLLVSIPFSQSQNEVPTVFYTALYYVVLGYAAVLGGALVSIVLMLYNAITDLISVGDPNQESHLLMDQD